MLCFIWIVLISSPQTGGQGPTGISETQSNSARETLVWTRGAYASNVGGLGGGEVQWALENVEAEGEVEGSLWSKNPKQA